MPDLPADERIRRRRHREMLVISSLVVILAILLQVRPDGRVQFWLAPGLPLPESCPSYAYFGVKCPGCGLTRSFIYLAHGSWAESWHVHRIGWLLAAAVVVQFPYRILALRRPDRPLLGTTLLSLFGWALVVLLLANWLFNVICETGAIQPGF
jgi:hypothetical protein